jgi:hypothetical protein
MHGGVAGSGAPAGERNGNYKSGRFTQERIAERQFLNALLRGARAALDA